MAHQRRVVAAAWILANLVASQVLAAGPAEQVRYVGPSDSESSTGGRVQRVNPVLRVDLFNMAALPLAVLMDAQEEATAVYKAAGVTLVWSDRPTERAAGSDDVTSSEPAGDVRVIVVGGTAERRFISDGRFGDTILGYATTKAGCFCGRYAYIFSDRTLAVGYQRGNPTSLLGRIIAHEVGHLLLSSNSHAGTGIMRSTLDIEPSIQPRFTQAQMKALRRGIARLQTAPHQEAAGR